MLYCRSVQASGVIQEDHVEDTPALGLLADGDLLLHCEWQQASDHRLFLAC